MKQQIRAMEGELTNVVKEQAEFTVHMNDAKVTKWSIQSMLECKIFEEFSDPC